MNVKQLKAKLEKLDNNLPVAIEGESGQKYTVLTAKKRKWQAGHSSLEYCWLPIKEQVNSPAELKNFTKWDE